MSRVSFFARSLTAGLTVVVLAGCEASPPTAPAAVATRANLAVTNNSTNPFAFDVTECGITVAVSGVFHAVDSFTAASSGQASARSHINAKGTGIAEGSGAKYQWNDVINVSQQGTLADGPLSETFTQRTRLVGQGSATDIIFDLHAHVTTNANGVITVQFDNSEVGCR